MERDFIYGGRGKDSDDSKSCSVASFSVTLFQFLLCKFTAMAFGKNRNTQAAADTEHDQDETYVSETQVFFDVDNEVQVQQTSAGNHSEIPTEQKDPSKPLFDEVTFMGTGNSKNAGGAKQWICNHCKCKYTSSYTRIHVHFFGAPVGKKADIKRCPVLIRDKEKYNNLFNKVKEVESGGVSKSLKNSVLSKNASSKKRFEESFGLIERNAVDLKIIRGLCANGIPFNVLRNPQFIEMIHAIKKAPDGYKPPSFEKARTVLLDECYREVEKDLTPVRDTWYTQGVSIVSDGWSNVKNRPLINVVAANSRGAMFMYAEDFSGVEKSGTEISKFLLGAIENIGPSNVLQVVTDNAANCKAAGREIEKVEKIVVDRWEKMTIPLHCLGFALSPKFYDKHYLERLAPGGMERKAPNQDREIVVGVMEAFKRIAESEDEEKTLREQWATFHMKKGIYSMAGTQADAVTMDGIDWWATYGSETPELAEVAKKVLSQPISSSSAERNWSTYSYIHNVKRNRLNCSRADKLVYIHSNIRLQSRFSESYKSGPNKKWDMNPESDYIEGSNARLEEMVWENLDDEGVNNGKGKRQRVD